MIRIDELYNNVFLPYVQDRPFHSIHYFDPFGKTDYEHLCSHPFVKSSRIDDPNQPNHDVVRFLFWDQEPLHVDITDQTLSRFCEAYWPGLTGPNWPGTTHIITSEFDSEFADRITSMYGFRSHYYFFHAWASLDWYRGYNRTFLYQPFEQRNFTATFLCPNNIIGGKRKHRLELLNELVDRELIENNVISFPERCPYENKTVAELCQIYDIHLGHVDLPLIIDEFKNHANNSHSIDLWQQAEKTLLQLVTETVYEGRRNHLTEKTFRPIVMQQPFILVSCQGSLEYLKRYGFKTFSSVWDESYDTKDDATRILSIGKLLSDIENLSKKEKQQLQKYLAPIVAHNHAWFYSREFEQSLWNELTEMMGQW